MSLLDDLLKGLNGNDKPLSPPVWPFERVVVVQACKNCIFYSTERRPGNGRPYEDVEVCRKNPPDSVKSWPRVQPSDWCGSFQATQAAISAAPRANVEKIARNIQTHLKREDGR